MKKASFCRLLKLFVAVRYTSSFPKNFYWSLGFVLAAIKQALLSPLERLKWSDPLSIECTQASNEMRPAWWSADDEETFLGERSISPLFVRVYAGWVRCALSIPAPVQFSRVSVSRLHHVPRGVKCVTLKVGTSVKVHNLSCPDQHPVAICWMLLGTYHTTATP